MSAKSVTSAASVDAKTGRLVFVRKPANALQPAQRGESEIRIGECVVRIESFRGQQVRVVVEAPVEIPVFRGELKVRRDPVA